MELNGEVCYRALLTRDSRFDGRLFTGVKTTGIYCRPICPARPPKPENCTFFPSAAAAQAAGFRPCLRCRPEVSPKLAAWQGTSNTVHRALGLIESGTDLERDLEALSLRLGVGTRHLRRLFQQHVGVSPKAVLQSRRVLFAKQLITETAMPLIDVAMASGFSSLRTFNHAMRQTYDRAPSDLRRTVKPEKSSEVRLHLPYSPPYDWDAMLKFLAARAIPGLETVGPGSYERKISLGGKNGLVRVKKAPDANALEAEIRFPEVKALPEIVRRLRCLFDLGAHPATIGEHLAKDPVLAPLVEARPGLRIPGAWDGFEMAVRAILGQQISVDAATKLAATLSSAFEFSLEPKAIADSDLACLRMPESRKQTIRALARAVLDDPGLFSTATSLEESNQRLCSIPGIGGWTAQYIAMRALREPDAFPAQDVGLLRGLAKRGLVLNARELLARAEQWRPWRAYAVMHLWTAE